ncbi:hypothetical protein LIER_03989 [Lithospermum erythrorhizon]|uniref:Uncharacterized protein n=1 Tax=Lithospermum erythrorhizon TaxID=34254 RepID=A0AAV3NV32_LITER
MADSSNNPSSRPIRPSQTVRETLHEVRLAKVTLILRLTPPFKSLSYRAFYRRSAMEEEPQDFVGSLLKDSPEALHTAISPDLDDSRAPLDVQPLRSRMRPPTPRPIIPKPSKGKSSKEPHTLE